MSLPKEFIAKLPKVELHLHLEGSLRPDTLRQLTLGRGAMESRVEEWILEREKQGYRYSTFAGFIEAFKFVVLLLDSPKDYALATIRLMESLAEQNVKYAEITLAAGVVLWKQQPLGQVYEAVRAASLEAGARLGMQVNWIFDAVRQFGPDHAREVMRWASRYRSEGVVAFGLGGDEERGPAALFADVYREARDCGLHTVAHAGETTGPDSVRKAVELLKVERIGHGLAAARDPEAMALLRDRGIPLEGCPGSNVAIGLVPEFRDYPLPTFLDAGVSMTLNSDDPALFGTSIGQEFTKTVAEFALSAIQAAGLCENAVRAAFLPDSEKEALLMQIKQAVVA
ncbi:MAG: adenosine deaminase [Acidobacteria bacterium]|nr:MAG: adenosine deaminase [Acidobacteriota bacterium]